MKKVALLFLIAFSSVFYGQTVLAPKQGGTGVNNGTRTITLATPLSWPANAVGALQNNGAGVLSWSPASASNWMLNGNTVTSEKWIGTVDNFDMPFRTNNTEWLKLKANGHFLLTSNIYTSADALSIDPNNHTLNVGALTTIDWANLQLKYSTGVVSDDWGNGIRYHSDASKSWDFVQRLGYDNAGVNNIKYGTAFIQIKGSNPDIDLTSFSGSDFRIAGDPDGTAGTGLYLKAYNTTGAWRTGIKYINQAISFPDLILQPDGGLVGIRTSTPDEELHVVGSIKMVDGNEGAGKLFTSDAAGVGSWQTYTGSSSITTVGTVTTGTWNGTAIGVQYGGTGSNLSATGGTSQVLKQVSAGAAVTVGQLAASDLSNGTVGTGSVVLSSAVTTTFTPTWGSTGTQPNIGDGTILGWEEVRGDEVTVKIIMTLGGTSTLGTGTYTWSLLTAAATTATGINSVGTVRTNAGGVFSIGSAEIVSAATTVVCLFEGATGLASPTVPGVWANGNSLKFQVTYKK